MHIPVRICANPVIKPVIALRHSRERNRQAYLSFYVNRLETTFLSPGSRASFFLFFTLSALIMLVSPADALTLSLK